MRYRFYRILAAFMKKISPSGMRKISAAMAFFTWYLVPSRKRVAIEAMEKHLGLTRPEATKLARKSFKENFTSFLQIFHVDRFFVESSVSCVLTPETLSTLLSETAPMVVATAHIGSWELMPGLANDIIPDRRRMVIVRQQKDAALNRIMAELRGARGMEVVNHRQASEAVLAGLRKKGMAAFLVDHNTNRKEAVFLNFLGDTAAVNIGPAMLALRARAAVYPLFLIRDGKGKHLLYIFEPLRTSELQGTIAERVEQIARFYTDAVARIVRQHPEQWFWMHKRWKTRAGEDA